MKKNVYGQTELKWNFEQTHNIHFLILDFRTHSFKCCFYLYVFGCYVAEIDVHIFVCCWSIQSAL